ncbi:MAG: universal stress protein [Caldilinea sp. CFX5]|nr:universal stress protein [Caldilinea sp. CFX5]
MFKHILLATDGSAAAERAADYTASLAMHYDAKVTVLYAYAELSIIQGDPTYGQTLTHLLRQAASVVVRTADKLHGLGVAVEEDALAGQPATVILNMAESRNADVIILGARGVSPWNGVILGSTSMAVVQGAKCPVLVIK